MINLTEEINLDLPEFELMMSGGTRFFFTGFILYSISLFGAIFMWKLRKIGFHLYTVAQIFIIALPVAFIPAYPFSMLSVLVTAAFLIGYAVHLKINGLVKLSGMEENENLSSGKQETVFFIHPLFFCICVFGCLYSHFLSHSNIQ